MLRLTLRQIEYVAAVADSGSLTEAAARLNVSQPALSVAIAQVEQQVGITLFQRRKGRRLAPTAAAPAFLDRARELLSLAQALEDPARAGRGEGRLRLGCFQDLAPVWLPGSLTRLRAALPGVEVVPMAVDFARLADGLREGAIDLAISYDLGLDASVRRQVLARVAPHAFLPPGAALAAQDSVTLADLARHPLILFDEGLSVRHMLRLFQSQGLHPLVRHRVATLEIMRSLAAHGEGIGISYTRPPADVAYDGTALAARRIVDAVAEEPVVLALPAEGAAPLAERAAAVLGEG